MNTKMKYIEGEYYIVKWSKYGTGTLKDGDLFKVVALKSKLGKGHIDIKICNRFSINKFFVPSVERVIVKACSILKIFYMK